MSLLLLQENANADDSQPIHVSNSLPIMQGSGLSAPKASRFADAQTSQGRNQYDWSLMVFGGLQSHANDSGSDFESLIIDGEVHQFGILSEWNFLARWQLNLELSLIRNTSGDLDNAISRWHDLFGLDQGDRDELNDNQLLYQYYDQRHPATFGNRLTDSTSSISDAEVSLGYQLYVDSSWQIAAYVSAILPSGDADKVSGSNKTDIKLSLALGGVVNDSWAWHSNAEIIMVGDEQLFEIPTQNSIWTVSAGVHWRASPIWRWSAQLDGHSEVFKTDIDEISDAAWQLTLAVSYGRHWQVYFAEDLSVNRSADFSFGLNWLSHY